MTGRAVIRDAASGGWLLFGNPREIIEARFPAEVMPALGRIERGAVKGLWGAGYVAYEAAPAFDRALVTRPPGEAPLLRFGLYDPPVESIDLPPPAGEGISPSNWSPSVDRRSYRRAIGEIRRRIGAGETYQVNYTFRLRAPFEGDPYAWFVRLAAAQESGHAAYLDAGRFAVLSASPELFFDHRGEVVTGRPMKGTAPRGLTTEEDEARAEGLRSSAKERAENLMIVDMIRNDLGRIAETGSVETSRLFDTERYPTVWQMTSTVRARTDAPLPEIFRALFPCASVTGAPKARTMSIIAALEDSPRGIYTGAVGFVAPDRRASFSVAIRTVVVDRERRAAEYGVGGGVLWESTAEGEYDECLLKAKVLVEERTPFSLLETMLWTRDEGWFLAGRHLRRLAGSARYFGFSFDEISVRLRMESLAATFAKERYRVRLLLDRRGGLVLEPAPLGARDDNAAAVAIAAEPVRSDDPFLYHKTTHRRVYDEALAAHPEAEDVILLNERGEVTESCFANVVVEKGGRKITPPVRSGLLAGTFRAELLEEGEIEDGVLTPDDLRRAERIWLVNSVRGWREAEMSLVSAPR
ncbi:MAG: aminodeoxychorismate synthase component I [Candidatus Eisenbacteria bacterium]